MAIYRTRSGSIGSSSSSGRPAVGSSPGSGGTPTPRPPVGPTINDGRPASHVPGGHNNYDPNDHVYSEAEYIREDVMNSDIYKQAYSLFSSSPDYSMFLQRLQGILDSITVAEDTFWDRIGVSNKFDDSLRSAYDYAIEQIQLLVKEFHEWYNSLPATQVQQYQDAGINAAITGAGVSGSTLNGQTAQRNFVESTDPAQQLATLSDIALSKIPGVVSTISGVWKSLQDVRLANRAQSFNEKSWLADTRKSLLEQGFTLNDDGWNSVDDFYSWTQKISEDPKLSKMFKESSIGQLFSDMSYNGIMSVVGSKPTTWTQDVFGVDFEEFYNDLGNFQLESWYDLLKYRTEKARYDSDYWEVRDGKKDGNLETIRREHETFVKNFEKTQSEHKLAFLNKWIERAKSSKDPVAKFAVNQILFDDPTVALLDTGADLVYNIRDQFKESGLSPVEFAKSLLSR